MLGDHLYDSNLEMASSHVGSIAQKSFEVLSVSNVVLHNGSK